MDLFLDLEKFSKKMLLDISKPFPSEARDTTAPYFHPIENL